MWSLRVWSALLTFPIANSLMWEAFLCILEYLAAPLAFTSQMPVAAPQSWQSVMSADIVKCSPESWNPPGWEPLIWGHQSLPVLPHASWDYPSVFLPRWASFLFLLPPLSFNFYFFNFMGITKNIYLKELCKSTSSSYYCGPTSEHRV